MKIIYPVHRKPIPESETWIRLEVNELKKRGHRVEVVPANDIPKEKLKNADFVYCHFATLARNVVNLGIPFAVVPHAVDIWPDNGKTLLEVSQSEYCKFIVAVSDYHLRKFKEWGIKKYIYRINYAVDINTSTRTKDIKKTKKIVCGGRFVKKKGLEYAIQAVPNITVFGDEPEKAVEKISKEYLMSFSDKAKFVGWLTPKQLAKLYNDSWLLISPNIETEGGDTDGLPLTILEALSMGLQVITTKVAGIRTIKDYVHFVPQRNIEAIKEKIKSVRKELNTGGILYIRQNHSPEAVVERILKCLA